MEANEKEEAKIVIDESNLNDVFTQVRKLVTSKLVKGEFKVLNLFGYFVTVDVSGIIIRLGINHYKGCVDNSHPETNDNIIEYLSMQDGEIIYKFVASNGLQTAINQKLDLIQTLNQEVELMKSKL